MTTKIRKGAAPYKGGCRFTVWAPHADEVFVVGSFNDWNQTAHPMSRTPDGVWESDVPGARPGDEYRYRIVTAGEEYLRIDPYARQQCDHPIAREIMIYTFSVRCRPAFHAENEVY